MRVAEGSPAHSQSLHEGARVEAGPHPGGRDRDGPTWGCSSRRPPNRRRVGHTTTLNARNTCSTSRSYRTRMFRANRRGCYSVLTSRSRSTRSGRSPKDDRYVDDGDRRPRQPGRCGCDPGAAGPPRGRLVVIGLTGASAPRRQSPVPARSAARPARTLAAAGSSSRRSRIRHSASIRKESSLYRGNTCR